MNQIFKAITNIICVALKTTNTIFPCQYCGYVSKRKYDVTRHAKFKHNGEIGLSSPQSNKNQFGSGYIVDNMKGVFDIRLKENFKLFVSGPSRCGKTVFVAKWYNVKSFATKTVFP